jgi:aspartate-semialdehyde dehydrogenase
MTHSPAGKPGLRVGLAGASSLLGQEILRVLKERGFPVGRLSKFEAEAEDPDLPVLDLSGQIEFEEADLGEEPGNLDLLFLAARPRSKAGEPGLLGQALAAAGLSADSPGPTSCLVVDAAYALGDIPGRKFAIPACENAVRASSHAALATVFASPHPATIVLTKILTRLANRFSVKDCVAQVFFPASELGPRGIEELQKQTLGLLSFQKVSQKVFGAQLAFNLLSRLSGKHSSEMAGVESAIRRELREFLPAPIPSPALRPCHAAVFYSLAFSILVELGEKPAREALTTALSGNGITVRQRSEAAPNPVDVAGSAEIILDAVTSDPDRPGGYWIWAAVDNIRLAAENAVDIAQRCLRLRGPKQ